jgi:hypothetical protein
VSALAAVFVFALVFACDFVFVFVVAFVDVFASVIVFAFDGASTAVFVLGDFSSGASIVVAFTSKVCSSGALQRAPQQGLTRQIQINMKTKTITRRGKKAIKRQKHRLSQGKTMAITRKDKVHCKTRQSPSQDKTKTIRRPENPKTRQDLGALPNFCVAVALRQRGKHHKTRQNKRKKTQTQQIQTHKLQNKRQNTKTKTSTKTKYKHKENHKYKGKTIRGFLRR